MSRSPALEPPTSSRNAHDRFESSLAQARTATARLLRRLLSNRPRRAWKGRRPAGALRTFDAVRESETFEVDYALRSPPRLLTATAVGRSSRGICHTELGRIGHPKARSRDARASYAAPRPVTQPIRAPVGWQGHRKSYHSSTRPVNPNSRHFYAKNRSGSDPRVIHRDQRPSVARSDSATRSTSGCRKPG
jgi:hypothetical protein